MAAKNLFDPQELIQLAQDLIRFPNTNPPADDQAIAAYLYNYMNDFGLQTQLQPVSDGVVNVIGRWEGDFGGPTLLLNGHMDVVPEGEDWTVDPFGGVIKDGWLYGRGAVDMKANLAALVMAVRVLKRSNFPLKGTILLTASSDEEVAQIGTRAMIAGGLKADYGLVAEPSQLNPMILHKGRRLFEIQAHGISAHSALPQLGVNAVEHIHQFITMILAEPMVPVVAGAASLDNPSFTITSLHGGKAVNAVPDFCRMTIDYRYLPQQNPDEVTRRLRQLVDRANASIPRADLRMQILIDTPGLDCPADMPLISSLQEAVRENRGTDIDIKSFPATSDAGFFQNAGIPTVIFGAGDLQFAHKPDERIEIADLVSLTEMIIGMIKRMLG